LSPALRFGGVRYLARPELCLTPAAYYQSRKADHVSNAVMGVLGADYILSKRTDV
jgi:predicted porin